MQFVWCPRKRDLIPARAVQRIWGGRKVPVTKARIGAAARRAKVRELHEAGVKSQEIADRLMVERHFVVADLLEMGLRGYGEVAA
ncbi:hypothetical protein [Profundibacterium mesophilum]|uniref:Uncharacterized protein n=1 Tax=Profundibacterium mesophilum KAUST100406-0324 TaxID=1037889 RepID=A0A921TC01_9RHOB|nr:hypothetical protein [Profundibacterium mesophilum]KAF0675088.1 hypothetical protein PMES_02609 [Profundibacterium mesophilum KAUST100406-0324]